jgi:iron complex transport system ATP-binding protein
MQESPEPVLSCRDLGIAVPGRALLDGLSMTLSPGDFLAVLGQNGAGKTLTLHTLAGLRPPAAGQIRLDGRDLETLRRRLVAARLALLPQDADDVFPATVLETVLVGRHPHLGAFEWESLPDRDIARTVLEQVGLADFDDRELGTLSGGERRRVAIAQVLAQSPAVYLLDEPTNHLDPQHQLQVLSLFAGEAARGCAVVATLHDANLAARFATRCLLLFGDGRWQLGPTEELLSEASLSELYATPVEAVPWRGGRLFIAAGTSQPTVTGEPASQRAGADSRPAPKSFRDRPADRPDR